VGDAVGFAGLVPASAPAAVVGAAGAGALGEDAEPTTDVGVLGLKEGVTLGGPDSVAVLFAGSGSVSTVTFSSDLPPWPVIGSQGALELPPARVTTSTIAKQVQAIPSIQPIRRSARLRLPLPSTKTGLS
jgi:hypothetical protein